MMNQTKKHTTGKKLLALLLALIMTVSLLPMSVFAAETDAEETPVVEDQAQQDTEPVQEPDADSGEEDADVQAAEGDAVVYADTTFNYVTKKKNVSLKDDTNFYRIFLLDCGRRYFSVDEIKGLIDQLAANHFTHIELAFGNDGLRFLLDETDAEGNAVKVGDFTMKEINQAIQAGNDSFDSDVSYRPGSKEELTQTEMDTIIDYANEKGIGVIPMFDAPGHMYTVVTAMQRLMSVTENVDYKTETSYSGKAANWKIIPTSATAVNFVQALMQKYVDYFAGKNCTMFNIAADESSITSDATYTAYVDLINSLAAMVQNAGMAALAFNDGINKTSYTSERPIDTNIAVCYWTEGEASAEELSNADFTIINNTNDWYYVLGDYLYVAWGGTEQWSYKTALTGINKTPVTKAKDGDIAVAGSVLCCWCDGPSAGYTDGKGKVGVATSQTNQQSVYNLIKAMADANPDYFKAEETPAAPELVVDTDASTVKPVAKKDGTSYSVTVKEKDTVQLKVTNYTVDLTWKSSDDTIATVENGLVTFTGKAGTVTITAEPAVTTRGDDTVFTATFEVAAYVAGNLENIPAYVPGTVAGDNSVKYVLDTDDYDSGSTYLIVAKDQAQALLYKNGSISKTDVTIKSDNTATVNSSSDESNALWTITNGVITNTNNSSWLYIYQSRLYVGSYNYNYTWTIGAANATDGTRTISQVISGSTGPRRTFYLCYNNSTFGLTTSSNSSNTVRLYKQVKGGYTVDTTSLVELINYADKLNANDFSNWDASGVEATLDAANTALKDVSESYTDKTAADNAQDKVNTAASNLYEALAKLVQKKGVDITVFCVDEDGVELKRDTIKAYETDDGKYEYNTTPPSIPGYSCEQGNIIEGTVDSKDDVVTLTYTKADFSIDGSVEIPITIVDYRADGLLFDFTYDPDETAYNDSYRYGFIHTKPTKWGVEIGTGAASTYNSETGLYEVNGYTSSNVEKIEGTVLQKTGNTHSTTTFYQQGTNNDWSRAGLVEETLGANGMPVYTNAAVKYVAGLLEAGYYKAITENGNSIIYDTFVAEDGPRSVSGSSTEAMSAKFSANKTWDNIENAYDLAWYLLNTLYMPDTNMTDVLGTDEQTHSVPIYGMGVSAYNKIILKNIGDGIYRFDASQSKTNYDTENSAIYEDDSANSVQFYPLENLGYEQPGLLKKTSQIDTQGKDPNNRNGDFTLRGESQFVYDESADLYFQFKGDDDVYMYINGVLALDLGGAHGSNTKKVELNTLNKTLYNLKDGEIATFTFFYMERCSDYSTFAIETNMNLVQRGIKVEKKGYDTNYQNEIKSGSVIETGTTVAYDLTVTNKGKVTMENIAFKDVDANKAEVSFGSDVTTPEFKAAGGMFTLSDSGKYALFITVRRGANDVVVTNSDKTFESLQELSEAVAAIKLAPGQTLHVRFLQVTADIPESTMAEYNNKVTVTAVSGKKALKDEATHVLYSYNAADTAKDYVVDFGLPLVITGIFDKTAEEFIVDEFVKLSDQSSINYGTLKISDDTTKKGFNTELTYTLKDKTTIDAVESIVLDVKYKFGSGSSAYTTTLQKTIRIIPATTVYYEDDFMSFTNMNGTVNIAAADATNVANGNWQRVGKQVQANQALDQVGVDTANNYGYDPAYTSSKTFSLGSAVKVTVDKDSKGTAGWPYATFTFQGTGFDIISLTDNTSGAIYVDIYKGAEVNEANRVTGYVVNNFYGYTYDKDTDTWTSSDDADGNNAIYQVPVIKASGLDYAKYTVKIKVAFSKVQNVTGTDHYSFWMDAIRVYDPANDLDDYAKDGEQNPDFVELRKVLLDAESFNGNNTIANGAVFIDGKGKDCTIDDYKNYGPNHEVYLAAGQAVAFQLVANAEPAGLQLGAKLANGDSATLTVTGAKIKAEKATAAGDTLTLATATDMFYTLNVKWTKDGDLWKSDVITLTNSGIGGMISLTNLKLINAEYVETKDKVADAADGQVLVTMMMDADAAQEAIAAVDSVLHPQEVKTFEPERFEVSWNRSTVKVGQKATLTVKTSTDVDAITVDGVTIDTYRTRTQRTGWGWNASKVTYREFTYTVTAAEAGTLNVSVTAVNAEGTVSEPITAAVTVQAAAQRPGFGGWLENIFGRWF